MAMSKSFPANPFLAPVSFTNTLLLSNNNSLYFIPLVGLHEEINIIINIVKVFL